MRGADARVLDAVTLSIAEGEHTALVGPNGSGKSSLIKLITRVYWPLLHEDRRPAVRLFGQERWNVFDLRAQMGIVTPELDRDFIAGAVPALDAVLSGFFASQGLWHRNVTPAMRAAAEGAMKRLHISHLASRAMDTMSSGEVRRVLIARALVHRPRALLLDEPTSGLDLVARREFLETVRRLAREGTTLLLVTHHIEEIIPEIGRLVLLRAGKVAYDGPKEDGLTDARLSAVFGAPFEVRRRDGYYAAELC